MDHRCDTPGLDLHIQKEFGLFREKIRIFSSSINIGKLNQMEGDQLLSVKVVNG